MHTWIIFGEGPVAILVDIRVDATSLKSCTHLLEVWSEGEG